MVWDSLDETTYSACLFLLLAVKHLSGASSEQGTDRPEPSSQTIISGSAELAVISAKPIGRAFASHPPRVLSRDPKELGL